MMKIEPTQSELDQFAADCEQYRLVFKCRNCVHMVDTTGKCGLEYPNTDLENAVGYGTPQGTYVFCKHFELE